MALLGGEPIDRARRVTAAAWWDDGLHTASLNGLDEGLAVIPLVPNERLGSRWRQFEKRPGLADIAGLPSRQHKVQRQAQGVGEYMDLGAEPTPRPTQRLGVSSASSGPGGTGMGANHRGIDQKAL